VDTVALAPFPPQVLIILAFETVTCLLVTPRAPRGSISTEATLFLVWVVPLFVGATTTRNIHVLSWSLLWWGTQVQPRLIFLVAHADAGITIFDNFTARQALAFECDEVWTARTSTISTCKPIQFIFAVTFACRRVQGWFTAITLRAGSRAWTLETAACARNTLLHNWVKEEACPTLDTLSNLSVASLAINVVTSQTFPLILSPFEAHPVSNVTKTALVQSWALFTDHRPREIITITAPICWFIVKMPIVTGSTFTGPWWCTVDTVIELAVSAHCLEIKWLSITALLLWHQKEQNQHSDNDNWHHGRRNGKVSFVVNFSSFFLTVLHYNINRLLR
jgi:hypothetical protein